MKYIIQYSWNVSDDFKIISRHTYNKNLRPDWTLTSYPADIFTLKDARIFIKLARLHYEEFKNPRILVCN